MTGSWTTNLSQSSVAYVAATEVTGSSFYSGFGFLQTECDNLFSYRGNKQTDRQTDKPMLVIT